MRRAAEFVGYQLTWFVAVIGAGLGLWWPGVAGAAVLAAWQVATAPRPASTGLLGLAGVAAGLLLDGALAHAGLVTYAAPGPDGWMGPPLWILALWAVFAMTLHASFDVLQRRPWLAAALGAIGGPLAYLGAARGWSAVAFEAPAFRALALLALGWAVALPALSWLARATATRRDAVAAVGRAA